MSQKLRNLIKVWGQEGYEIVHYNKSMKERELAEVFIRVAKEDGTPVKLHEEWDTIKGLASMQNFYALPMSQSPNGLADVTLVTKSRIHAARKTLIGVKETLSESYWYLQGDADNEALFNELSSIVFLLSSLQRSVRSLTTVERDHAITHKFINGEIINHWYEYKKHLSDIYMDLMGKSMVAQDIHESLQDFFSLYIYTS